MHIYVISLFLFLASAMGMPSASIAADVTPPSTVSSQLTGTADVVGMAHPWQLNFQAPQSPVMEQLNNTHTMLLWIITIVSLLVLAITLYIVVKFNRKSNPNAATFTHNVKLEVIWTVIPIIILIAIAVPSVRMHYFMEAVPTTENAITLKVTGNQWYWSYAYPDHGGFGFDSYMLSDDEAKKAGEPRLLGVDNRVVVPVNTPVHVLLTASDVIHAWALPAFGVKRDAVPGRLNESWFTAQKEGIYYGQCSELCGKLHGFMPIAIEVVSEEKFNEWVAAKQKEAGIEMPAETTPETTEATPEIKPETSAEASNTTL